MQLQAVEDTQLPLHIQAEQQEDSHPELQDRRPVEPGDIQVAQMDSLLVVGNQIARILAEADNGEYLLLLTKME